VIDDLLDEVEQRIDLTLLVARLGRLKPLLDADVDRTVVLALLARGADDRGGARHDGHAQRLQVRQPERRLEVALGGEGHGE
jgi:hypothetical protein